MSKYDGVKVKQTHLFETNNNSCLRCGRQLKDPESIKRGYGLSCSETINRMKRKKAMKEGPNVNTTYTCTDCNYLVTGEIFECSEPRMVEMYRKRNVGNAKYALVGCMSAQTPPTCPFLPDNRKGVNE